jgi:hypothetical protein
VTRFKPGDEVFVRLPECHRGSWSELARTTEEFVALKPQSLSMADAASVPLAAMTALQALRGYEGDLNGKTIFVPAGCKLFSQVSRLCTACLPCNSRRDRSFRLSASEECFWSWQGDHHGFDSQSFQGERPLG